MAKSKKIHPRSEFKSFSSVSLKEAQENADEWLKENSHIRILKKYTKPMTNNVFDLNGAKWYEIEIEYLD